MDGEVDNVLNDAFRAMKQEVAMLLVDRHAYVMCHPDSCPFKENYKREKSLVAKQKRADLKASIRLFRKNMFDVEKLVECHVAFESYLMSNFEKVCDGTKSSENDIIRQILNSAVPPEACDHFESDRSCARLANLEHEVRRGDAVLSEDFDCVALFGADMMIKDVYSMFFTYTTLKDVMNVFHSNDRLDLVRKCCVLGTDYNLGVKGIGPVKITKIDENKSRELFETCMSLQSTDEKDMLELFALEGF